MQYIFLDRFGQHSEKIEFIAGVISLFVHISAILTKYTKSTSVILTVYTHCKLHFLCKIHTESTWFKLLNISYIVYTCHRCGLRHLLSCTHFRVDSLELVCIIDGVY